MKKYNVLFLIVLVILFHIGCEVDFNDYPALLEKIDDDGTITLDTYNGKVSGKLEGVQWKSDKKFIEKAKQVVSKAKADTVAFVILDNKNIKIWYQSVDGAKYMNKEIQQISESF